MNFVKKFQLKIIVFTALKNHYILHRCVFVMSTVLLPDSYKPSCFLSTKKGMFSVRIIALKRCTVSPTYFYLFRKFFSAFQTLILSIDNRIPFPQEF